MFLLHQSFLSLRESLLTTLKENIFELFTVEEPSDDSERGDSRS
jgi:hypothetical protein